MKGKSVIESEMDIAVGIGKKFGGFSSGWVRVDGREGGSLDLEKAQFLDSDDQGDQILDLGSNPRVKNLSGLCVNSINKLSSLQSSDRVKLYVDLNLETDSTGDSNTEEVFRETRNLGGWIFNERENTITADKGSFEKQFVEVKKFSGHQFDHGIADLEMKMADDMSESSNKKGLRSVKISGHDQEMMTTRDHVSEKEEDHDSDHDVVILDVDLKPKQKFHASDLVWCRGRRRRWWPGQIHELSSASENAKKFFKEDNFLVAHFGVHTYSWTTATNMMPFENHFSRMVKRSSNEEFEHAVDCALDEISRRVEFSLSCGCLPEQVYTRLKTQLIFNDGIKEQCSRRDGGGRNLKATAWKPKQFMDYLKSLAQSPFKKPDKMEFVVARSLVSSFYRYKGYPRLPEWEISDCLNFLQMKEKNLQIEITRDEEEDDDDDDEDESYGHKRKYLSEIGSQPLKKETMLHAVITEYKKQSSSSMDESVSDQENPCREFVSRNSLKKRRMILDTSDEDDKSNHELVNTVASSQPAPRNNGVNYPGSLFHRRYSNLQEAPRKHVHDVKISHEYQQKRFESSDTTKEMFSRLCSAAVDPFHKHSFMEATVFFFTGFSIFSRKHNSSGSGKQEQNMSQENTSDAETEEKTNNAGSDTSDVEILSESSWKDRLTERHRKNQTPESSLPEFHTKTAVISSRPPQLAVPEVVPSLSSELQTVINGNITLPKTSDDSHEDECYPTALCLKFTSLPSLLETNLSEIFTRYGPLVESEILPKSKQAKVVFRRRSDAETAFSNVGKHHILETSLVSYRLKYIQKPASTNRGRQPVRR